MAASDLEAFTLVKKLARQFGPLAQLEGACERVEGFVAHETELVQRIEALKKQLDDLQQKKNLLMSDIAATKSGAEVAQKAQLAEHAKAMNDAQSKADAVKKTSDTLIAGWVKAVDEAKDEHQKVVTGLKSAAEATKAALEADHAKYLAKLKADQDAVVQQTAQLRSHLSDLKSKLSPFLTS